MRHYEAAKGGAVFQSPTLYGREGGSLNNSERPRLPCTRTLNSAAPGAATYVSCGANFCRRPVAIVTDISESSAGPCTMDRSGARLAHWHAPHYFFFSYRCPIGLCASARRSRRKAQSTSGLAGRDQLRSASRGGSGRRGPQQRGNVLTVRRVSSAAGRARLGRLGAQPGCGAHGGTALSGV